MSDQNIVLKDISGNYAAMKAVQVIYKEAFPRIERKPFVMIVKKQKEDQADILGIYDGEKMVGMVVTMRYGQLLLVDYLAIDQRWRDGGYGTAALSCLKEMFPDHRIFLEIETVLENTPAQKLRRSRKAFYLRNGMRETGIYADVFTSKFEVLSYDEHITYEDYIEIYRGVYGSFVKNKIRQMFETEQHTLTYRK